jgi:hypothetical protein
VSATHAALAATTAVQVETCHGGAGTILFGV